MSLLNAPKSPRLLNAPEAYQQRYHDLSNDVLRLYFAQLDNLNQVVTQRVSTDGIVFPDGTEQTTAYNPAYTEAYDRSASIALTTTPTLLIPNTAGTSVGITYSTSTGVFTWVNDGEFSLSLVVNAIASTANQFVYIYAQNNTGAGWVNTANSGKSYQLINNQLTQVVYAQAVHRTAGQQVRYYIYSNSTNVTLQTSTMPGVTPTVYVPAIRIQYAGG